MWYDLSMSEERIYIKDAAAQLNRRIGTIRKWELEGRLPDELIPKRNDRGWRYWTQQQLEETKQWMEDVDLRPGKGLAFYNERPSQEKITEHIDNLRKPKD